MTTELLPALPKPISENQAGTWSMHTYGADRIMRLGQGSSYQLTVQTKDSAEKMMPDGVKVSTHMEAGKKTADHCDKIVTAQNGDVHLTFNETSSVMYLTG